MSKRKILLFFSLITVILIATIIYVCNRAIEKAAAGKLYTQVQAIPSNKVALLLGTSKHLANGAINPYYAYRIEATVELFKAGKVQYIIVSGDNSRKDYNEPQLMQGDLIDAGIDSSRIYLDYAGFRTFDSIVRLREIFEQDTVTIVSQPFHNERALYIANREGITAIGYNAKDVGQQAGWRVQAREKLARVKVFLDYLVGKQPKYLGTKIAIP